MTNNISQVVSAATSALNATAQNITNTTNSSTLGEWANEVQANLGESGGWPTPVIAGVVVAGLAAACATAYLMRPQTESIQTRIVTPRFEPFGHMRREAELKKKANSSGTEKTVQKTAQPTDNKDIQARTRPAISLKNQTRKSSELSSITNPRAAVDAKIEENRQKGIEIKNESLKNQEAIKNAESEKIKQNKAIIQQIRGR